MEELVGPILKAVPSAGAGMCPEFLREGSGVADFYAPPMIVVGTADPVVADTVTRLFGFLSQPVQVVGVRTAEALKYACNAFHATKVSFTNELSRLFRLLEVDSREVMSLFCEDRVLNISPAYLRPGYAFGGSCLPKDLRSLLHLARISGIDLPLLAGTMSTNDLVISEVVDRVVACDSRKVALLGLSFKANTDDLRESPNVELAERLIGKGFDIQVYDQIVNPAQLVGANRRYVESKLPHLQRVLTHEPGQALRGADVAVVSTSDPAVIEALVAAAPRAPDRPQRAARPAGGGAARIRGDRLVSRVLIIVQNLPVPFDRRVWLECRALVADGHQVTVVCPKGKGDPAHAVIESVEVFKYRPYAPGGSKAGFILEYVYSFLATAWLVLKARRKGRFAVLQACNPPDIFWPIAIALRAVDRTRFVFDHHDLCPELFRSRFPGGPGLPYRGLLFLERRTHRTADHVISTNDSYRDIAINRSGKQPGTVTVVRTGPDPDKLRRGVEVPELRRGRRHLVTYIGVMGPQDGVDIAVRAAAIVVRELHREDVSFTLIGSGDCFDELVRLRDELGLGDYVEFTGRAPDDLVAQIMSTADAGLSPDPLNPLNDLSTMNKTMEYMAYELPVVAFDLRETRVSAGDAAVYVTPNDEREYAEAIVALLDDEPRRAMLGKTGRVRVEQELAWSHQARAYLGVYERMVAGRGAPTQAGS